MAKATATAMVDVILPGGMVVAMTPDQHAAYLAAQAQGKGAAGRVTIKANRTDMLYDRTDPATKVTAKVPGKGNVGVYGIQRMPITLYPNQWEALFALADDIRKCIAENKAALSFDGKGTATATAQTQTHSAADIEAAKRLLGIK